jgi:hypothetical protein
MSIVSSTVGEIDAVQSSVFTLVPLDSLGLSQGKVASLVVILHLYRPMIISNALLCLEVHIIQ